MSHKPYAARHAVAAIAFAVGTLVASAAQAAPTYPVPSGDIMDVPMDLQLAASVTVATPAPEISESKYVYTPAATTGPLTRAEVREALANARSAGTLVPTHEIGDTNESIAARDAFNELQAEVVMARWADEARVMAEAAAAERAALVAQQEIDAVLALGRNPATAEAVATSPVDRRDVIDETTDQVE